MTRLVLGLTMVGFMALGTAVGCESDDAADDDADAGSSGAGSTNGGTGGSAGAGKGGGSGAAGTSGRGGSANGGASGSATAGESGEAGAGGEGGEVCEVDDSYRPMLAPGDFVAEIDNPFWPLTPGTRYVFGGAEDIEVTVTSDTYEVLGIPATVVRDTVSEDGEVIEDTFDWYAQDSDGNVWYLGEDTKEYEGGVVVSTAGSWQAGVDGAYPGIVMHAVQPDAGEPYRQEYYPCEAEDYAEIVRTDASVSVPYGDFDDCVQTREFTPLEPSVNEYKYYCSGVGLVLEVDIESGARVELISVDQP